MLKRLCAVLVTLCLAGVMWAPSAMAWAPNEGPLFNNPKGSKAAKFRLQMRVEKAIRNTPRGSKILIATYLLDRKASVRALVGARRRGVAVQVVMDGGINTGPSRTLKRVLNRDNGSGGRRWGRDNSFARQCRGSCRGGAPNQAMHAKFYAFSRTGSARNVVMVSSANLNRGGAVLGYNDLFTMRGVPRTFNLYEQVHREMARDRVDGNPFMHRWEGRFETHIFPKRGAGKRADPIYRALGSVRCRGTRDGAGRNGRTAIFISMFGWGGERGMYLARRLLRLNRDGCWVSVIYGAPSHDVSRVLRNSAWRGGINLHDSRVDRNGDGRPDLRVHHKYMLINGRYKRDRSSFQVFTGSANWTNQSLRGGDENTLHINSRPAYRRYIGNWKFVRNHGSRQIGR